MPVPLMKPIDITVYVDADHTSDLVTRRSVTGILILINSTLLSTNQHIINLTCTSYSQTNKYHLRSILISRLLPSDLLTLTG